MEVNKMEEKEADPYAYTKRTTEFTSENFKIDVRGLPKYFPMSQVKKLFNDKLNLGAHKIKPHGPLRNWAYVNFRDEASRNEALKVLDGYKWKNNTLSASSAQPARDPLISYKENNTANNEDDNLTMEEKMTKVVTPWAHLTYEQQLKQKNDNACNIIRKLGFQLAQNNPNLRDFVSWNKTHRKGLVCEVEEIRPSPVLDNYRNKCEFTIGINPETKQPTVGFRLASYKGGSICVGSIDHLKNIPIPMKAAVKLFEEYIRQSGLGCFDPISHSGTWRQLTVRTSNNDDLLLVIVMHPQNFDDEKLKGEKKKIVDYLTNEEQKYKIKITSIYFHCYAQRQKGNVNEYEHFYGGKHVTETIRGKKFRVSPDAFLQVNTLASEVLYKTIGDLAAVSDDTVMMDVCCGTGTIGLSLSSDCKKILGVDIVSQAIEDARYNAEFNNVKNAAYFDGKAEEHINTMLELNTQHSCVAVVDPPRAGLHRTVICALRKAVNLQRFVFASCDPRAASQNFIAFGRPTSNNYKGSPFIPVKAIPVDMFPHTPHFELVVLFERFDEEKWKRIVAGNPRPCDQKMYDELTEISQNGSNKRQNEDVDEKEENKKMCNDLGKGEET